MLDMIAEHIKKNHTKPWIEDESRIKVVISTYNLCYPVIKENENRDKTAMEWAIKLVNEMKKEASSAQGALDPLSLSSIIQRRKLG
jgi:hypothetical protein